MIESFNGGVIDVSSVLLIINKLRLYIENEEEAIKNISNSLSMLQNYYSSDNNKIIETKVSNLYISMNILLENRKKYVDFLEYVLNSYIDNDEYNSKNFNFNIN